MLQRVGYVDKLFGYKDKELIKVVSGIRRCGKSTLLELFRLRLLENGVAPEQIQTVNFEDVHFSGLTDYMALHEHILSLQP
jgi:predicted AAA+ superfamily ATPase